ncbi:MAG TPA: hypothetical protein VES19_06115 [Candidatus Limnocylindrales bacterium]|nr:hypothetical protein [Candidatus Limnocylindrales bacterium]
MNGTGASGSGSTADPGPRADPGSASATPTEVELVEQEMLGLVVDAPAAGGLNPHGVQPGTTSASPAPLTGQGGGPAIGEDLAALDQLIALADETPTSGPTGPGPAPAGQSWLTTLRAGRLVDPKDLLVAGGITALFAVAFTVFWMQRSAGGDAPATGAQGPAQSRPEEAAAPSGGGQPGGGDLPGGAAIPASCLVPVGGVLDLELVDVSWSEEEDGLGASWTVEVRNRAGDPFQVFLHDASDANAATRANGWTGRPTDWRTDGSYIIAPDAEAPAINRWHGGVRTSVEPDLPTFCSWEYVDRLVAVYPGPACRDDVWAQLKAAPDAAARETLMRPLAVDLPIPQQMATFQCPP